MINLTSQISVILPTFNEQDNIAEAIERISKVLGKALLEIIIVDDNSEDNTLKVIEGIKKNRNDIVLIHRKKIRGLSSAIAEGVDRAKGNIISWLDCDLGIPPEELKNLLKYIDNYDIVIGSRFINKGRDTRKIWITICSYLVNFMAHLILSKKVTDYTSGFICLKRKVLNKISINPNGFGEYFIELMYDSINCDFKIKEVGYVYNDRKAGNSKSTSSLKTFFILGLSYVKKIFILRFKKYD